KKPTDHWTFNADGTCTFIFDGSAMEDMQTYSISSDSKTLILSGASGPIECDITSVTPTTLQFQTKDLSNFWTLYR
ncbi:MAG: hypothetical protein LPK45_05000, partial [Bacteroidota bacterium]|nr:hypothetical protein [Bacteroidota bacterium]MDX5430417.1 hypothetical protein [Bacteroidota bacterium]MDX5469176.1 hypothetical protein [Bacteroidota bacterium]